eukprot:Pgem_evm1s244
MRSYAASFASFNYNLLGYFLGPYVVGVVDKATGDKGYGFKVVMAWSTFGFVFMLLTLLFAIKKARKHAGEYEEISDYIEQDWEAEPVQQITDLDVSYNYARTRSSTFVGVGLDRFLPLPHRDGGVRRRSIARANTIHSSGNKFSSYGSVDDSARINRDGKLAFSQLPVIHDNND